MGNAPGTLHHAHRDDNDIESGAAAPRSAPAQLYGAYGLPVDSAAAAATPPSAAPPPLTLSLLDDDFEEAYASGRPLHQQQQQQYERATSPESPLHSPPSAALPSPSPSPSPSSGPVHPVSVSVSVSALDAVPLDVQLQYIRVVCQHLDYRSLLAAGRVNTHWRRALAPEPDEGLAVLPEQSPVSAGSPSGSGSESLWSPMSGSGSGADATPSSSSQAPPSARAPAAEADADAEEEAEEEEEDPRRSASAPPAASFAALHMNPFASPLGWAVPPVLQPAASPSDAASGALSPSEGADSAGDSSTDSESDSESDQDGRGRSDSDESDSGNLPRIRFHLEPVPVPRGLGPHLARQAAGGRSAWHPALELCVPARDGWLKYASRSGVLRGAQRLDLRFGAERIACATRPPGAGLGADDGFSLSCARDCPADATSSAPALSSVEAAQLSLMNTSVYSCSPYDLLPQLRAFPHLRALRCSLPLERRFHRDGRARMQAAFECMALTLRELHWELLPEQPQAPGGPDSNAARPEQQKQTSSSPAGAPPVEPARPALLVSPTAQSGPVTAAERESGECSSSERAQAFCLALLESLPLLSLTSLSLSHFILPPECDLAALHALPLLQALRLSDLAVTAARVRSVRGLQTLRHLSWQGWSDEDAALFAASPPPALVGLELAYAPLGVLGLRALARCAVGPRLALLRLDSCDNVGDECCGLVASRFRGLRALALRLDSPAPAFSGAALCSLATLPALTSLELVGAGIPLRHCLPQFCAALRATMDADADDAGHDAPGGGGDGDGDSGGHSSPSSPGVSGGGLRTLILEQVRLAPSAMEVASLAAAAASDNPGAVVPRAFAAASSAASQSAAFKHLTQLRTLTALAVRRCAQTNNLLAYVCLLPQLRRLELERRRTPAPSAATASLQPHLKPASPPAAALLGASHCTRGSGPPDRGPDLDHGWSTAGAQSPVQAQAQSQSESQARADGRPPSSSSSPDPFGSLLLLSSMPRLEHLTCNFAQPRAAGEEGDGGCGGGDAVLDQLRQLQGAFLARGGRRVYCEWRGQRVPPPAPGSAAANHARRSAASPGEGEDEEEGMGVFV